MALQHSDLIYVKKIRGKGRGVFAKRPIRKGVIIEQVPVVILPVQEIYTDTISTKLADYVFNWGNDEVAIALGYGSLYNHSYQPNAAYAAKGRRTQVYSALRDIGADEEITVNYNGCSKSRAELWFDAVH
ncbi:MAG: SET domain-containing protein [Geminicoccaceae bacterium]